MTHAPTHAPTQGDVLVGVLLDNAREEVMRGVRLGVEPDVILVSSEGLAALAAVKREEIRRGVRLRLLGKSVHADPGLTGEQVTTRLLEPDARPPLFSEGPDDRSGT